MCNFTGGMESENLGEKCTSGPHDSGRFHELSCLPHSQVAMDRPTGSVGRPPCHTLKDQVLMDAGLAERPPRLPHSQVLMGAGLAGISPCLPHSQVLMGAGLAGRPPCLPHSQALMGAGLAGRPPCLPHSQALMGAGLAKMHQHIPTLKLGSREKIKRTDWSPMKTQRGDAIFFYYVRT